MARVHGKEGVVAVGGSTLGVTRWSFTPVVAADESTGMDSSGYRTYLVGLKGATLSIEGKWESDAKPESIKTGNIVAFSLEDTATANIELTGNCVVTQSRIEVPVDGAATFSLEGQVTATWTETAGYS